MENIEFNYDLKNLFKTLSKNKYFKKHLIRNFDSFCLKYNIDYEASNKATKNNKIKKETNQLIHYENNDDANLNASVFKTVIKRKRQKHFDYNSKLITRFI